MGLNKRDRQDKLKSQSLLDSERSSHDGGGDGGGSASTSSTTRTVVVDHGTIMVPVETVVSTVSSSSKQSKSASKSSSSKQHQILHSSTTDAGSIAESVHLSTEKSFGALDGGVATATTAGSSKLAEQKFSTVSSVRSAAQKSKQIDNIIEKIHHIASDTISTTEQITTAAPSSSSAASFTHGTKDVTQKKTGVLGDGSGGRQSGSVSGGDTIMSESSATQQQQQQQQQQTQQQHNESRSSKTEQSSSTMQSSSSSSTMKSSSSTKSHKEAHSKSLVSGETAHSSLRSQKHLIDGTDVQNGGTVLGVSSLITTAPDHSTYDQQSFQTIGADGSRKLVDSQSYSMAKSQAPTTKILYDAAGNQITSTSASYQSAQGHSTSSFQTSGTHDHSATDSKLHQASTSSAISSSHRDERVSTSTSSAVNSSTSSSDKRFSVIDSTTLENYSSKAEQDSSSAQHSSMLMKNASAHTVASLSSAHDSLDSTIQSTQLVTESSQLADHRQQHSESSKTIESASHYEQMDERSSSRRKTSEFREQRESNAAILKRKIYDENGRRLNLIDEKIVPKDTVTADLQDDVTNVTKTSFEAKLFNPTLKRWELVDQKTILEKDITTEIPVEIVKELEVERPELANITTTIQLTKVGVRNRSTFLQSSTVHSAAAITPISPLSQVYDAKTKQWKTVDQKKHIDVVEKITYLEENSGRSELNESEHSKNLRSMDMVDRVTIKEVQDLSEEKRQQLSKSKKRVDERTVQEQCICEICTCGRHNCFNCGGGTTSTQTKSSKYISSSKSENFYHQENFTSELNDESSTIRRGTWTKEDAEQHQANRRESYTIEHSSTENDVSGRRLTWTKDDFEAIDISKIKGERPKPIRHEDNLKPEGQFYTPERQGYTPGERVQPIKHDDNLRPEGEFSAPAKPEYRSGERPKPVRPQDNLKPEGEFERPQKPTVGKPERSQPVRHDDNLRPEGDFERPEKSPFRPAERPKQVRPDDNLRPEGEFQTPERPEYRSGE
uniref:Uncharacterized protein n=1 Tax=Anopheles albimanus TaxID=7167 RepID=A0A182F5Y4_ANOAL